MTALLAVRVVKACIDTGVTLATAESLTAGLVAARIAEVPGCSAMLRGGVIAYATDVKAQVLGLDQVSLSRWLARRSHPNSHKLPPGYLAVTSG